MSAAMIEHLRKRLIADYRAELATALQWQAEGKEVVDGGTAGAGVAKGREEVPISEYITHWEFGLNELQTGADPDLWNY